MRIGTALKRRDQLTQALRDCFSHAQHFGQLSRDMEEKRREIIARVAKGAPEWVRAYADGYWRCMIDSAYRNDLVHGGFYNGKFYSTHSKRDDYYEKHGIEPGAYADDGAVTARGHYWKESLKPFFVG